MAIVVLIPEATIGEKFRALLSCPQSHISGMLTSGICDIWKRKSVLLEFLFFTNYIMLRNNTLAIFASYFAVKLSTLFHQKQ